MTVDLLERAAEARKAATRRVSDRPRERRACDLPGAVWASRTVTRHPIEVRDAASGGTGLDFVGYASVTEADYEMYDFFGPYTEIVSRGAFEETLGQSNLDVPLVLNHDSLRRIARTTNGSLLLAEDETGLLCDAPNLDPADADVAYIAPKLRSGLIDEMSFRFSITSGQWSPDYTEFRINGADIQRGDVAIVGYGASPHTSAQLRELATKLRTGTVLDGADLTLITEALRGAPAEAAVEARGLSINDLSTLSTEDVSALLRNARAELQKRDVKPPMTLRELELLTA